MRTQGLCINKKITFSKNFIMETQGSVIKHEIISFMIIDTL